MERRRLLDYAMMTLAVVIGAGSILLFAADGALHFVKLGFGNPGVLAWDALLSCAFFLQHSGMVRRRFRARLGRVVPPHYQGAVYAIASGVALTAVVLLWQPSETRLLALDGAALWTARVCAALAVAGFVLSACSLRTFDPLGLGPIRAHLRGVPEQASDLTIRGPYRWVRHPLYFFILVLIWSNPNLTADRLLFSVLWTAWILVGAVLEEADLMQEFGESYRAYRRKVPMLLPWPPRQ
jgi:methanethiol S-methyltransferase